MLTEGVSVLASTDFISNCYVVGNIPRLRPLLEISNIPTIYVITELSCNIDNFSQVNLGTVLINIVIMGVYYRKLLNDNNSYFDIISSRITFEH